MMFWSWSSGQQFGFCGKVYVALYLLPLTHGECQCMHCCMNMNVHVSFVCSDCEAFCG